MSANGLPQAKPFSQFILGDPQLHSRFSMAIALIVHTMVAYPRTVTTHALAVAVSQTPRRVRAVMQHLHQTGLVERIGDTNHSGSPDRAERAKDRVDAWIGRNGSPSITLADVFRSVRPATDGADARSKASSNAQPKRRLRVRSSVTERVADGVSLLLMQAAMDLDRIVLQQLQSFDLERLRCLQHARGGPILTKRSCAASVALA